MGFLCGMLHSAEQHHSLSGFPLLDVHSQDTATTAQPTTPRTTGQVRPCWAVLWANSASLTPSIPPSSSSHRRAPGTWPSRCRKRVNVQATADGLSSVSGRRDMVQAGFPTPVWEKVQQLLQYLHMAWHPVANHSESSQDLGNNSLLFGDVCRNTVLWSP